MNDLIGFDLYERVQTFPQNEEVARMVMVVVGGGGDLDLK